MRANRPPVIIIHSPYRRWKESITFKLWVVFLVGAVLPQFSDLLTELLTANLEEVWAGKFWVPFFNWAILENPFLYFMSLCGFFFLGLPAERRLGPKVYLLFIFTTQIVSSVVSLVMVERAAGGMSGMLAALLMLYAIPPRFLVKNGILFRMLVVMFSFQFFGLALTELEGMVQMGYYLQLTTGMALGLAFLLLGRLHSHSSRKYLLLITLLVASILVFNNPWHPKWPVYKVNQAFAKSEKEGRALLNYYVKNGSERSRIEFAVLMLEDKLPGSTSAQAIGILDSLPDDVYAGLVLSNYYLGYFDTLHINHAKALQILKKLPEYLPQVSNAKALLFCASPDSVQHNLGEGLRLSQELNTLTRWNEPAYLNTYASCLSLEGQFQLSANYLERALMLGGKTDLDSTTRVQIEKNLERVYLGHPITYPLMEIPKDSLGQVFFDSIPSVVDSIGEIALIPESHAKQNELESEEDLQELNKD